MAENSNIEWTDCTWNPVSGCTRASEGCDNCYAVTMTHRLEAMGQKKYAGLTVLNKAGDRHFNGKVRCDESALSAPFTWRKPRRVFVNSMSDLFHKDVPFAFVDKVFAVMALCPQHTYQILTKRPERMREYLCFSERTINRQGCVQNQMDFRTVHWSGSPRPVIGVWPLPNVWLGASVENQEQADKRIPQLLMCPAAVRFLSCEPLLGSLNLCPTHDALGRPTLAGPLVGAMNVSGPDPAIDWVIIGGESGRGARPCDVEWIRSIVRQCESARVHCFVKQLGSKPSESSWDKATHESWGNRFLGIKNGVITIRLNNQKGGDPAEWPEDLRVRQFPVRPLPGSSRGPTPESQEA